MVFRYSDKFLRSERTGRAAAAGVDASISVALFLPNSVARNAISGARPSPAAATSYHPPFSL